MTTETAEAHPERFVYSTQLFNGVRDYAPPHGNQFCKLFLKLAPGRHTA